MPKIKHTKNELKTQRDALLRFRRYLPTLELKKQQLQVEVRRLQRALEEKQAEYDRLMAGLESWVALFAEDAGLETLIRLAEVRVSETNIAGISIPVFQEAVFERKAPDLFDTPPWIDDAMDFLESAQRALIEKRILEQELALLKEELLVTSQRVNLFEKIKIPEAAENIRVIRIFLGDDQTAGVARSKIAKAKSEALRSA
ncbi:MAG: V-type ATP synthase subunit D [bacterium ADurb.Bin431]|nr:MAG: V-type ATP synthase subunit D [bacterium ADurb.Bin431]